MEEENNLILKIKMEFTFRTLTAGDINAYREIRLDCLQNHPDSFGTLYENEVNSTKLKFDKVLKSKNSPSFLNGVFNKEMLIGICGFTREESAKKKHRGTICQLYVRKDYSEQSIGKQLLKFTLDTAFADETLEIIELGVVMNNQKAIKLYSDFGFISFGNLENYFKLNDQYWTIVYMALKKENYLSRRSI